jgi:hypothetical protein
VSKLDGACNILEPYAISKSLEQQHRISGICRLRKTSGPFLLLLAALYLAPFSTLDQLYTGSVTGVVTDSSGATIPRSPREHRKSCCHYHAARIARGHN